LYEDLEAMNTIMTDPIAAVCNLVDACQAGLTADATAVGGTAMCIDNLNPFAGMRHDFAMAFSTNCPQESARYFGHGLFNFFSTLAIRREGPESSSHGQGGTFDQPKPSELAYQGDTQL
jgi:hypothetical protein